MEYGSHASGGGGLETGGTTLQRQVIHRRLGG